MKRRDLKPSEFKKYQHQQMMEAHQDRGPLSYNDLRALWKVKHPNSVLQAFKHFGWLIPKLIDRRVYNGYTPGRSHKLEMTLDPDACQALALDLARYAIEDIRAGKEVGKNIAFLRSPVGSMALSLVTDPAVAMEVIYGFSD